MQRDSEGRQFFGFCGQRVYVPDDDPRQESISDGVLRRFRERLRAALEKPPANNKPANVGGEPNTTATQT